MSGTITHVVPVFKPGGAELQLATLATAQARSGHRIIVLCLTADGPLGWETETAGVSVVSLREDGPRAFLRAAGWAARGDVVHSWMYHGHLMGALLRPFSTARHVWGIRRTEPFSPGLKRRTRLVVRLGRLLAPRAAHGLVFCSQTTMDRHVEAGFRAPYMAVTLNALPPKFLESRPKRPIGEFTAGCLTRWTFDKGIDVLLESWSRFLAAGGRGRLVLAGPDIDEGNRELVEMVLRAGVADSVALTGPYREPRNFYRLLDIYVSPSRTEGFPNVVAEAMATGLPVIATDVGGTSEVMGQTGRLIADEDTAGITAALLELSEAPDLRHQIGHEARSRCAAKFTVEACEAAVSAAYLGAGARHDERPEAS